MYLEMLKSTSTPTESHRRGQIYDLDPELAAVYLQAGMARETTTPPEWIAAMHDRLSWGAGRPCLFLPFLGEFGHLIMTHIRLVHWHRASRKVVCCRPGQEVLFPSAVEFVTDWIDPISDVDRIATLSSESSDWPALCDRFDGLYPVTAGALSPRQQLYAIHPDRRIPFRPRMRGLRADVVVGVRRREFAPERNWLHWPTVAAALSAAGLTFAVIGDRMTSYDLPGQLAHSGDLDTDAAIELLKGCRLYLGTDSGGSHLASTVGAPMLIFRETAGYSRDLTGRMAQVNPGRVEVLPDGWTRPADVIRRALELLT